MNELLTISKLKQAQLTIHEVKELDEIKRLIDQSEALKGYARAQQLSREMQNDIAEYNLYATRQMGAISSAMGKAKNQYACPNYGQAKIDALANAGIDRRRAYEAEKLAVIPEPEFAALIAEKREADELTKTAIMNAISKPHVAQNSGNNEWYTPAEYIEAACEVMGGIDLDPASSDLANEVVGAKTYYTVENDGLLKPWSGRVWMNPPYAAELIIKFSSKLKAHVENYEVEEAIVLVNNATETSWFNNLISVASAVVFPKSRIKFYGTDGEKGTPLQGQAIIYIGNAPLLFQKVFGVYGWCGFLSCQ